MKKEVESRYEVTNRFTFDAFLNRYVRIVKIDGEAYPVHKKLDGGGVQSTYCSLSGWDYNWYKNTYTKSQLIELLSK